MKNVVILSGSPRKGNSDALCHAFAEGAREAGHKVTLIRLAEKKIGYCTGCGLCSFQGKPCPIQDDARGIQEAMLAADVIVMASPVYFYSICAQMKTLIDRSCPYYERMGGKAFGFIMTSADDDPACMERTLEDFRGYLACLDAPRELFALRAAGLTHADEAKASPFLAQARELGRALK